MKGLLMMLATIVLAGCATAPVKEYVDRPVEVLVKVKEPCLKEGDIPAIPLLAMDKVLLQGSFPISYTLNAARQDRMVAKNYFQAADKVMRACR